MITKQGCGRAARTGSNERASKQENASKAWEKKGGRKEGRKGGREGRKRIALIPATHQHRRAPSMTNALPARPPARPHKPTPHHTTPTSTPKLTKASPNSPLTSPLAQASSSGRGAVAVVHLGGADGEIEEPQQQGLVRARATQQRLQPAEVLLQPRAPRRDEGHVLAAGQA